MQCFGRIPRFTHARRPQKECSYTSKNRIASSIRVGCGTGPWATDRAIRMRKRGFGRFFFFCHGNKRPWKHVRGLRMSLLLSPCTTWHQCAPWQQPHDECKRFVYTMFDTTFVYVYLRKRRPWSACTSTSYIVSFDWPTVICVPQYFWRIWFFKIRTLFSGVSELGGDH